MFTYSVRQLQQLWARKDTFGETEMWQVLCEAVLFNGEDQNMMVDALSCKVINKGSFMTKYCTTVLRNLESIERKDLSEKVIRKIDKKRLMLMRYL
jgi:hypothetical protein